MPEAVIARSKEHFFADLKRSRTNGHPEWFKQIRAAGASQFRQVPYPDSRIEEWRQTNISPIVNTTYQSMVAPMPLAPPEEQLAPFFFAQTGWTELIFVDGYFCRDLSVVRSFAPGVYAGGLAFALHRPETGVIEQYLNAYLRERNAYTALNTAFIQDGAYIHVPRNTVLDAPIHLVFVATARAPETAAHIRNLIVLEENSQAAVISSYVSLAGETPYLNNVVEEVSLGENAQLARYSVIDEGIAGNHLVTTEVRQARDSRQTSFAVTLGGRIVRNQHCTELDGEGSECAIHGLYLNDRERLVDNTLNITHLKPHCSSRIVHKGILSDKSKAVYGGKIHVHREAQQTDSKQLNNNLLLSDTAAIDTKPQLEIYADDVKCTHGATVGAPPEEVVFYFRSRGISEKTARGMLTYGFADEVLSEIPVAPLRDRLRGRVVAKYAPDQIG